MDDVNFTVLVAFQRAESLRGRAHAAGGGAVFLSPPEVLRTDALDPGDPLGNVSVLSLDGPSGGSDPGKEPLELNGGENVLELAVAELGGLGSIWFRS